MRVDITGLLASVAPQAGLAGVLLVLLGLTMRNASSDRTDYRQALADAQQRHVTERAELQARLDAAETRVTELAALYEDERRRRWDAEADAEQARRERRT